MKLEQSFEVAAPLGRVWEALVDVERVAPCLPGAAVTGRNDDGSYNGTFKVKIGPTSASYTGKLQMEQIDESVHTATMQAQGTDKRGQGGAKATIVSSLSPAGDGATRVDVSTDYHITGRLARFGRGGMIEDISNRLLGDFAKCLQTSLAGAPDSAGGAGDAVGAGASDDAGDAVGAGGSGGVGDAGGSGSSAGESGEATPADPTPGMAGEDEAAGAGAAVEAGAAADSNGGTPAPGDEPLAVGPGPSSTGAPSATEPAPPLPPMPESEPVQGLSLVGGALLRQVRQNPAPVVALLLGFLLALRVLRRRG
jgi:carbon monoxide dehydrogenase subunit G